MITTTNAEYKNSKNYQSCHKISCRSLQTFINFSYSCQNIMFYLLTLYGTMPSVYLQEKSKQISFCLIQSILACKQKFISLIQCDFRCVLGNELILCGKHVYNHFRDCKEVGSYLCGDTIVDVTAFYLSKVSALLSKEEILI